MPISLTGIPDNPTNGFIEKFIKQAEIAHSMLAVAGKRDRISLYDHLLNEVLKKYEIGFLRPNRLNIRYSELTEKFNWTIFRVHDSLESLKRLDLIKESI